MHILFLSSLASCALYWLWARYRGSQMPPGPRPLPVIGNAHQFSKNNLVEQFKRLQTTYGQIVSLKLGQTTVIILGSHKVAKDLLTKRASMYSSRPRLIMAQELIAANLQPGFLPDGPRWKQLARIRSMLLVPRSCRLYRPLQELEVNDLLMSLSATNDFRRGFHRFSSSLILTLLYGKRVVDDNDPDLQAIDELTNIIIECTAPGTWAVESFPVLHHLPRPFARWKQVGGELHQRMAELFQGNAASALERPVWNWTKQCHSSSDESHRQLAYLLGEIFEAGSHTTSGALEVAVLACVTYPKVASLAQKELDQVCGVLRLPGFEDFSSLPYTTAFAREVLRWRSILPVGIAHAVTQDDTYMGYQIPKGATIVANQLSMDSDGDVFEEPQTFCPDRWLQNPNLPTAAFGFGKRTCPGQNLAWNSLLLCIARLLWAFDVTWNGQQGTSPEQVTMIDEPFAKPESFEVTFRFRSEVYESLLVSACNTAPDFKDILNDIGRSFANNVDG